MKVKNQTIASRLTRKVSLTVLATMFLVVALVLGIFFSAMMAEAEGRYQGIMNVVSEKLSKILVHEEVGARNVFDEVRYNLSSPDSVYMALEKEVKLNSYIEGYYVAFEPGYFEEYDKWFEPYMNNHEDHARNIGSYKHDYLSKDWYKQVKKDEGSFWTDPYYDNVGAMTNVCSFVMPLYDLDGRFVGVCGADMSLKWLVDQLQEIDDNSMSKGLLDIDPKDNEMNFHTFIISQDGTYIAHPDNERVLRDNVLAHIEKTTFADYEEVISDMKAMNRGHATLRIDGVLSTIYYAPLESTKWSMAIVVPKKAMLYPALIIVGIVLAAVLLGLLVVWFVCRSNIRQITQPLTALSKSADEVAEGNFEAPLPFIEYKDEIKNLRDSFATMQRSLVKQMYDLKEKTAKESAIKNELALARRLQMSMIPNTFPERDDVDIFGSLTPAKSIGGDLYDFFLRDDRLFFCIGDVSGKGIPAALVMTVIHYMFRIVSARETDPKRIVEIMNDNFARENNSSMFCTFFLGVLDLKTHLLRYCNAGHELPFLITSEISQIPVEANLALGLIEGKKYKSQEVQLSPGDVFLLSTDGLKEAIDKDEECYGNERIIKSLQRYVEEETAGPVSCIQHLIKDVNAFMYDVPQADDLTLFAFKIK